MAISYDAYKKKYSNEIAQRNETWRQQNISNSNKKKKEDSFLYKAAGYIPIVQGVRQGANLYKGAKNFLESEGSFFKKSEGNFGQKLLSTGLDSAENITEGALSSFEGISDDWKYAGSSVLDIFGADDKAKALRKNAMANDTQDIMNLRKRIFQGDLSMSKTDEQVAQDDWLEKYSVLGTKSEGALQGVGNSLANAAMSRYLGGASAGLSKTTQGILGTVPIFMSARGQGTTEALESGASYPTARIYGYGSGAVEAGSEMMFGGLGKLSKSLGFGEGALDDVVIKKITDQLKGTFAKNLADLGLRAAGEGFEEVVSGLGSAFLKKLTYMSDEDLGKLIEDEKLFDAAVSGFLSSFIMETPSHVGSTIRGTEASTGITKNENKVVEAVVEERTKGQNLTKKEINQIRNEVREDLQNGYISTDTIEQVLGQDYDVKDDTYLQESYREQERRRTTFNTDLTQYKNENQRKIVQKAIDSGILNDSKKTHNFVDLVSKIAADKGMDFEFTNNQRIAESGFGVEGKTVNGYVNGNTIGLNIESNNVLNKVLGHEVTHVLEGTELYQALQDSLKSYVGEAQWNARIKELTETYKNVENADVTKELTADLVGENLFNNEDFVRSLSTKNRNLFQKIFDEIKYLVKVATAGSKEKRDLVKLQKVFQEAYRDSKTTREGTQYSINQETNELKQKQNDIIQESNPRDTTLGEHTWINSADDIKTYQEALESDEYENGNLTPDFTEKMVKEALDTGKMTVYSSYPIEQGTFVTPSKMEAQSYAGNGQVYSKEVNLNDVAWIDSLQGQYANTESDVKYSLTQDNQGRELSEQQQEYFKDSKVRDENGQLIEVYHGSPNEFTEFKTSNQWGYGGSYFTSDLEVAQNYGGNNYKSYLNLTNPLVIDAKGKMYDNIEFNGQNMDTQEIVAYARENGYDGLIVNNVIEANKLTNDYIAFNSNQIKNIDNTNPTSNPDIRYSLSDTDSQGKELSQGQKEFFKDVSPEVKDENNNLMRFYHGSNSEFTVFDITKGGQSNSNADVGFWFTPAKEGAENFANSVWYGDNTPTTYEVYLNLKNPKIYETYDNTKTTDQLKQQRDAAYKEMQNLQNEYAYESLSLSNVVYYMEMMNENELADNLVKNFHYKEDNVKKTIEDAKKYIEAREKYNNLERQTADSRYTDSYEQFRTDIYKLAGKSAEDANTGGTGMALDNKADYVRQYVENLKKEGYDGIVIKNTRYDSNTMGGENNQYVVFDSNQIKNIDNLNPTENDDIRYQLGTNDIAPTRGWDVRGRDIALEQALAPVKEQLNQLQDIVQELAPITEQEADLLPTDENIEAPTRYNLTPEESNELDMLEQMDKAFGAEGEDLERLEELRNKEQQEDNLELTPVRSLEDVRDIDEVARDRKANAYQYEHPEVKPYFQEEARVMLNELNESQKAERHIEETKRYEGAGHWLREEVWKGTKRETSPSIAAVLDGELGTKYTSDQIRKGLNAIIEDHGAENIAVAKRLEFILDDRLRNGYEAWTLGGTMKDANGQDIMVQPNQDYLNMLREQSWNEYYEQAPWIEEPTIERPQEIAPTRQTADEMLLPTQQATRETEIKNKRQIEPRKKNSLRQAYETVVGGFVNRNVLIDDLSKRSKNTAIKFKGDMWSNYMGEGQSNISNYQTDINGNAIGEGVNKIFENAENAGIPSAVFNEYLIDYSNIDRWRNNKGSQTPYEESARRLRDYSIKYPQIKQHAQKVWKYGENSLQNRVDAGLMSKETAQTLRELYPHYVPYISQTEDIDTYYKKLNELKPLTIKRARGGAGALMPVQEALAQYTMSEKKSIRQNALFNEIIDTIGEGNNFGADEKTDYTGMTDSLFTDENGAYLTAYKDGKQRTATIDMDLYNELSRTNDNQVKDIEERLSLLTKPLQKVSEIRRNILTTWSPSFVFKNAIKDIQEATFNSKYTKDMLKNYLPAFKELRNMNTKEAQQFVSLYGSGLTQGEFLNDTINESTRNIKGLGWLKNVNEIVELAPRYAEFKASLQNGATFEEAMYNAREVTTNFGRGGTIAKALNRNGFTFLNSSIQGFDKLIRNFSGENGAKGVVASLAKAAMFGVVPAIFNELAFGSGDDKDEEYEALPDYIKDNYYLIKFGDKNFIRIPKGRVLSIFGSAARRTIEAAEGEEGAFDGFLTNAWSQTGVNNPAENNIFAPLIQAANNQAWYGGDIVPSRLQDKPTEEQYDASVDNFSIWLGKTISNNSILRNTPIIKEFASPYKANYILDQYTGGLGDIVFPMITEEAKSNGSLLAPVVDQFTADSTTDNKYVSDFYSKKDEITKLANGSNATDEEKLQKKYLDSVSLEMSELYKERREVQADKSLSKKEKYEKSQNIKEEINKLAKEGLDNYQNVSVSGDFAEINGNNYQKGEDGKWKKVKEKTSDDTKALGLTGNESDSYVKTTENIKNIKDTYSNSTVRKNKVLTEIKNSNLPKEAKLQLYKDNYKDQMVDNYMDLGMDINSYLDYKTQDFTADKDKYGKSISGSKKQKVFDYINNMNIPFEQKIMLAKQEYPNYNEYNQEIVDYLNKNKNIDYNEMEKILLDLGFKVDEQGNISW